MLKIFQIILFNIIFFSSLHGISFVENKKIKKLFDNSQINGTFVLYDVQKNILTGYNEKRASTPYIPASTFKIYNALIGLSTNTVKNVDEIFFIYDGTTDMFFENWKKDSNLRYGIKVSHLPAFQELARKIGMKKMQKNVDKLNYGNKNLGNKVDTFWLDSLKITPIQQTELLTKFSKEELPFDKKYQEEIKQIIFIENINGWDLYGKTGLATKNYDPAVGWFVGWVEKDGNIYSFALNIDMIDESYVSKRISISKKSLEAYGLLK